MIAASNVSQIVNPVESLSLHFCRSARNVNCSDPRSILSLKRSEISRSVPIAHLVPADHELESISINFGAKCLSQYNPCELNCFPNLLDGHVRCRDSW
ncbi:unnamed protein product [Trichobilharzia regenti]|nr:unnamed protein product [Trichobilharzia regenti]